MDAKCVGSPYDPCPFVIRGIDSDNGNEFFSHHPLAWAKTATSSPCIAKPTDVNDHPLDPVLAGLAAHKMSPLSQK